MHGRETALRQSRSGGRGRQGSSEQQGWERGTTRRLGFGTGVQGNLPGNLLDRGATDYLERHSEMARPLQLFNVIFHRLDPAAQPPWTTGGSRRAVDNQAVSLFFR